MPWAIDPVPCTTCPACGGMHDDPRDDCPGKEWGSVDPWEYVQDDDPRRRETTRSYRQSKFRR